MWLIAFEVEDGGQESVGGSPINPRLGHARVDGVVGGSIHFVGTLLLVADTKELREGLSELFIQHGVQDRIPNGGTEKINSFKGHIKSIKYYHHKKRNYVFKLLYYSDIVMLLCTCFMEI